MLTAEHIEARIRQLTRLSLGLAKEVVVVEECDDLAVVSRAPGAPRRHPGRDGGLETARVALVRARMRLVGEG